MNVNMRRRADVAELVDALASGASVPRDVEVQVLSSVPKDNFFRKLSAKALFFLAFCGAKPKCSWGEKLLGQPLAALFWILAVIGGLCLVQ